MSPLFIYSNISVTPLFYMSSPPQYPLKPESGCQPSLCVIGKYENDDNDDNNDNKYLEGWLEEDPLDSDPEFDIDLDKASDSDSDSVTTSSFLSYSSSYFPCQQPWKRRSSTYLTWYLPRPPPSSHWDTYPLHCLLWHFVGFTIFIITLSGIWFGIRVRGITYPPPYLSSYYADWSPPPSHFTIMTQPYV